MNTSEFFDKLKSRYIWLNIAAMAMVVVALVIGAAVGLHFYTHHGEAIPVPDVRHKTMVDARHMLEEAGLIVEVSDTGYVKELPADCILEQTPAAGAKVKGGHIIRLIVNASNTPTLAVPDIADNCSLREAMAKLKAMGFKVGLPQYIQGEKDWVYGVIVDGRKVSAGDRVLVDKTLILQVGSGMVTEDDPEHLLDYQLDADDSFGDMGEIDDFEEI